MVRGINKVILVGNCGSDPQVRSLPNGSNVVDISLATTTSWNDRQTGNKQERTEWHRVAFFAPLADIVAQYVKKGSPLYIEGSLRYRESEKDGVKRYYTDIIAREMLLLGGGSGRSGDHQGGGDDYTAPRSAESKKPSTDSNFNENQFDDDLPF